MLFPRVTSDERSNYTVKVFGMCQTRDFTLRNFQSAFDRSITDCVPRSMALQFLWLRSQWVYERSTR
jgi:hypothetical protein